MARAVADRQHDAQSRVLRQAGFMAMEILGILALIMAPVVLLAAAARWGVDSTFLDVRSDF